MAPDIYIKKQQLFVVSGGVCPSLDDQTSTESGFVFFQDAMSNMSAVGQVVMPQEELARWDFRYSYPL